MTLVPIVEAEAFALVTVKGQAGFTQKPVQSVALQGGF